METVWSGEFESIKDIESRFDTKLDENVNILYAEYQLNSWDGRAFVLFEKDGELFEVNGSHCSCYGLEGQWYPEETTFEAIMHRLRKGNCFSSDAEAFFLSIGV